MKSHSMAELAARRKSQAGFTLIEVIIATTLGLLVLSALTSVVLTTMIADNTASGHIEASSQVRNYQFAAYDDFVLARPPAPPGCGTATTQCTTQDLVLTGTHAPNPPDAVPVSYTVRYAWDPSLQVVTRYAGPASRVVASHVTAYSWYVDRSGLYPTVVVNITVTIPSYNATYSASQTLRFYPRITATPSP
jgi:prepilin-type N-terminal cleavage/methylation domain-containing protein